MQKIVVKMNIEEEVKGAYSDCCGGEGFRNLNFRSSGYISKQEAIEILKKYVNRYNAFYPELLESLPKDSEICIAREGSVCIYVKTNEEITNKMEADEFDKIDEGYRIWWD